MNMITVSCPNNNIAEREYAIRALFDIIGCEVSIVNKSDADNYVITWNGNSIVILDCFWGKHKNPLSYLKMESFPTVIRVKNRFTVENDIIVLYGDDLLKETERSIECGIDVFASTFFMLTRWEEYVNPLRDNHNRFVASNSVAYKNGFLERPVVNEYAEMLWNMIISLDSNVSRTKGQFEIIPTHDIDYLFRPHRVLGLLKLTVSDVLKRKRPTQAFLHFVQIFQRDPIDSIDYIMDISDFYGLKSHFYFMSASWHTDKKGVSDYILTKKFKKTIQNVIRRGHYVGFHPGYFSYNNELQWMEEKKIIEEMVGQKILEGRQHYLMCSIPLTLRIWADNGMEVDSTLSYSDKVGFRCGTGNQFAFFDVLKRESTKLKEQPLIAMDKTLIKNEGVNGMRDKLVFLFNIGKKYSMPITILFHNTIFGEKEGFTIRKMYKSAFDLTIKR